MTMPFSPYLLQPDLMRSLQMPRVAPPQQMSIWDKMQNTVAPAPASGLLSEDDIKGARNQGLLDFGLSLLSQSGPTTQKVGFGQAIGQAGKSGLAAYQSAVDSATQRAQAKQAFDANKLKIQGMQTDMADQAKTRQARDAVFAQFPPPVDNSDPAVVAAWAQKVIPALVAAGDTEGATRLAQLHQSLAPDGQAVQTGNAVTTYVPGKGFFDPTANGGKGGYVPYIQRHETPEEIEAKKTDQALRRLQIQAGRDAHQESTLRQQGSGFYSRQDVKDVIGRASSINQAIMTVAQAGSDPALYKSAIANFVQAADQKAQLRSQMLQFFSNLDPSIGGRWETLKAKLLEGKLPAYQREQMLRHLYNLQKLTSGEYEQRRAGEIKRHPGLDSYLAPADEIFAMPAGAMPGSSGAYDPTSLRGQYGSLSQ